MRHLTTMEKLAAITAGDIEDNLDLYMTDADEEPVRRDIDQAVKSRFRLRNPAVAPLAGAAIGGIAGAGLGALSNAGNKYPDKVIPALAGVVGGLTGLSVGGAINAGSRASAIDEVSKKYVRRSDNARQLMMKRKEEDRAYDKEMYSKSLDLQSRGLDRAALLGGIGLAANAYASRGNNEKTASWGRETYGKAVNVLKNRANDVSGSAKTQYSNAATKLRSYANDTKKYTKTQYEGGSAKAKEYADKITEASKAKYNQAEEFAKNKYNQANDYARSQKEKVSPKTNEYADKINDWGKRRVDGTKKYYNDLTGKNYGKYTAEPDYLKYHPESQAAADKAKSDMWKTRGYTALGVGALGGGGYGVHALAKRDNEKTANDGNVGVYGNEEQSLAAINAVKRGAGRGAAIGGLKGFAQGSVFGALGAIAANKGYPGAKYLALSAGLAGGIGALGHGAVGAYRGGQEAEKQWLSGQQ